ncbi:energy transducer TonB [Aliiglaciecola sp. LCG003]|uniref:energy transducer TonB n=1 Tax=Aliiglaciecola sp. LCG003 TaxID=3053655 RepID=UPI0025738ACC|nr:energy transducer TonB [Aliiglaciecola sp. LCG003]WJG11232.1 energy transducer TonB [Aliiglaciecola sp. LCG003]
MLTLAPKARIPGWVHLSYAVSENGRTQDITVIEVSQEGGFTEDAVRTLFKWLYLPALSDAGKPIKSHELQVKLEVE